MRDNRFSLVGISHIFDVLLRTEFGNNGNLLPSGCRVTCDSVTYAKGLRHVWRSVTALTRHFRLPSYPTRWDAAGWTMTPNDAYFDACRAIFSYHLSLVCDHPLYERKRPFWWSLQLTAFIFQRKILFTDLRLSFSLSLLLLNMLSYRRYRRNISSLGRTRDDFPHRSSVQRSKVMNSSDNARDYGIKTFIIILGSPESLCRFW